MATERVGFKPTVLAAGQYRPKLLDPLVEEFLACSPAVLLVGPRGTGKTTSARRFARTEFNLSDPDVVAAFCADIRGSLEGALDAGGAPVFVDEWQKVPEVLWLIKDIIDRRRDDGMFIIAGSVNASANPDDPSTQWPLVHRTVRLDMLPMTVAEKLGVSTATFFDRMIESEDVEPITSSVSLLHYIDLALEGGYPAYLRRLPYRQRQRMLTTATHDVIDLDAARGKQDRFKLRQFLTAYARSSSRIVTLKTLASECDITPKTVRAYETAIMNCYLGLQIPAWATAVSTRNGRRPKRIIVDTGLWGAVLGLSAKAVRRDAKLMGNLTETMVGTHLRAQEIVADTPYRLCHYRDKDQREIDFILEHVGTGRVVAVEVKAGTRVRRPEVRHLIWLRDRMDERDRRADRDELRFVKGVVLFAGQRSYKIDDRIFAVPMSVLWHP